MMLNHQPHHPMNQIPFHELPDHPAEIHDGIGTIIPSGARVEVWRVKDENGFHLEFVNPIDADTESVLTFGLSLDAAIALHGILTYQLYPVTQP